MTERIEGAGAKIPDSKLERATIDVPKRGLIGVYMQKRKEAVRQANIAQMLKDAIIDRVDDIVIQYSKFLHEEFADDTLVNYAHPRVRSGHNHNKPKRVSQSHERIFESSNGKKRRVKYIKTSTGKVIESEGVRIENPDSLTMNYIYVNFLTRKLDMRDNTSHQTLLHGEPHIDSMTGTNDFHEHADILDTFDDEIKLLREFKVTQK
jgi:hypothetical protein